MRLIDKDKLLESLTPKNGEPLFDGTVESIINAYMNKIIEMYIADAEEIESKPVKHGRWIIGNAARSFLLCSNCGRIFHRYEETEETITKYCPFCGAKMQDS